MREPFYLTYKELRAFCPRGKRDILKGVANHSAILEDYGLTINELRLCHFLAQAAHETAGFRTLVEYGSARYFDRRYGHRRDLGNRQRSDGSRFRGRGIFQLTGRYNYRRFGRFVDVDLEANPQLAKSPELSLQIACEYWRRHDLNRFADRNDIRSITRRINGGHNGLRDRRRYYKRARSIWSSKPALSAGKSNLQTGDTGVRVRRLQKQLRQKGYLVAIDGLFGRETANGLKKFQKAHDLKPDGIFGPRSRKLLHL